MAYSTKRTQINLYNGLEYMKQVQYYLSVFILWLIEYQILNIEPPPPPQAIEEASHPSSYKL